MKLNIQLISIVKYFLCLIVVTMAGDQPKEKSQKEKLQRFRHHISQLSEGTYPLSVCLSVCLSVRLSVCPSVRLSVCPSVRLSMPASVCCLLVPTCFVYL